MSPRASVNACARLGLMYCTVWGQLAGFPRRSICAHYSFAWVAFIFLLAAVVAAQWQSLDAG